MQASQYPFTPMRRRMPPCTKVHLLWQHYEMALPRSSALQKGRARCPCGPFLPAKGASGFSKAPLAPLGCAATAHKRTEKRGSWAEHGAGGFCAGPALGKCRSYRCFIPKASKRRASGAAALFPKCCKVPLTAPEGAFAMIPRFLQILLHAELSALLFY